MANSFSSAPGKAIDFFAYAMYKGLLTGNRDREPTNVERLLAGSLAGMTSDSILYPLEAGDDGQSHSHTPTHPHTCKKSRLHQLLSLHFIFLANAKNKCVF